MELFVVFDTKGSGRLVGVFDSASRAQAVVDINRSYFQLHRCTLNSSNPDILRWALDDRERTLLRILSHSS